MTAIGALALALMVGLGSVASASDADAPGTIDDQFAEVNEQVPGFGGAYFEDGTLHVWLIDPSEPALENARRALVELVSERYATGALVALKADFTFRQLHDWRRAEADVLNLPGVVFTDVDEKANRLTIGVTDSEHNGARIIDAFGRSGVPAEAVRIIESDPVVAVAAPAGPRRPGLGLPGAEAGGFERPVASDDRGYPAIVLLGATTALMALFAVWRRTRKRRESLAELVGLDRHVAHLTPGGATQPDPVRLADLYPPSASTKRAPAFPTTPIAKQTRLSSGRAPTTPRWPPAASDRR